MYPIPPQAEGYNKVTAANAKSMDSALTLYRVQVCSELEEAFANDVKEPYMDTLVKVATLLGLKGEPNDVLVALAPHMKARIDRLKELGERDEPDKEEERRRRNKSVRLNKAWNMLLRPLERIKKRFKKAMPPSMLPPPPTSAVAAAPAAPAATLALPMASAAGRAASSQPLALMPPVTQPASSAPLALPPPSPTSYLRRRVRPRPIASSARLRAALTTPQCAPTLPRMAARVAPGSCQPSVRARSPLTPSMTRMALRCWSNTNATTA